MSDDSSFAEMLDDYMVSEPKLKPGDRMDATVVSVGKEFAFLDLGKRTEGLLPREEVLEEDVVAVEPGDTITVFITGNKDGAIMCGTRMGAAGHEQPGDKAATISALEDARGNQMPVEGTVKETIKGGFTITIMGQRAFCPISQIDKAYCEDPEIHVGHNYSFLINQIKEGGRNIVVSRRKLLELEAEERAREMWGTLELDAVYEGTVSSVKSYGAFVDIGGIEGLLHVSEISHERIDDPSSVLDIGQQVKVAIKEIDQERNRISLSLKALMDDPWLEAAATVKEGQILSGKVVRIAPFGAFVEIFRGIDGLVHISEMAQERRIQTPREVVREGQSVTVRVLGIDVDKKRISLSLDTETEGPIEQPPQEADGESGFGTFGDLFANALKK